MNYEPILKQLRDEIVHLESIIDAIQSRKQIITSGSELLSIAGTSLAHTSRKPSFKEWLQVHRIKLKPSDKRYSKYYQRYKAEHLKK